MSNIRVSCPHCGSAFVIPEEGRGKKGRCHSCGKILVIDELIAQENASGDDIMTWITEGDQKAQKEAQQGASRHPSGSRRRGFGVRLDHVNEMGAFFQFDSRLLYQEDLRSSFPQSCIICGATKSLSVHLIEWSNKRIRTPSSQKTGYHMPCVFELDKLSGASGRELLSVLGRVEMLPEPYSLPFPYYVCRSCSPVGAVVPDVRPSPDGQGEICELGVASAVGACDFAMMTCGSESDAPALIREVARKGGGYLWKRLPLAVRNRIGQWFEPHEDEVFLAYIPDADFSKAEAGNAGVAMTDRRLVYRKALAVVEILLSDNIRIDETRSGKVVKLKITSDAGKTVNLSANDASAGQLKNLLAQRTGRSYAQ